MATIEQMIDDYITTLPEDRIQKRHYPVCHYCNEPVFEDLHIWYGNPCHEECLRQELLEQLEDAVKEARVYVDPEYWE